MWQYMVDFFVLPSIAITCVIILNNSHFDVSYILLENSYLIIDYWFFIHMINTLIIALMYPFSLSLVKFWTLIIGWEIIENIILPTLLPEYKDEFVEEYKDTFGDLIAPIPATLLLREFNKHKLNM